MTIANLGTTVLDCRQIRLPRIPKREVQFLTPDEIQQYVAAIPLRNGPRLYDVDWLCFRALVEVLLGTGARISEALSLKRTSINFQTGEATIIGKGNKERVLFFSPRALNWVKEYVTRRQDHGEAPILVRPDFCCTYVSYFSNALRMDSLMWPSLKSFWQSG